MILSPRSAYSLILALTFGTIICASLFPSDPVTKSFCISITISTLLILSISIPFFLFIIPRLLSYKTIFLKTYISIDKRSKKARKEYYSSQRATWGQVNPATCIMPSNKAYNRQKSKQECNSFLQMARTGTSAQSSHDCRCNG